MHTRGFTGYANAKPYSHCHSFPDPNTRTNGNHFTHIDAAPDTHANPCTHKWTTLLLADPTIIG